MALSDLEMIPESGAVFTIGKSRFADNIASHFFIRKDPVVYITCGDEHSAVICQSGRLFVFGSNDWGQLGLGHKNHVSKPSCVKALKPEKVTHVACGRAHTLICTESKKIFACGSDQEGQLGRGGSTTGDSSNSPVVVYDSESDGTTIAQIAAGSHHSLALTSSGSVIAWGSNLEGQLGLPGMSGLINKPTKVNINERVKGISAGYYHSAFLTESGSLYVCGESESGKLGIEVSFSSQGTPKRVDLPAAALSVACGGHHTLILQADGDLYCTGSNSNGQLGLGRSVTEVQTPKLVPKEAFNDEKISTIACGESHSAVLTESGMFFICGDGRHGKLGLEENENNVHEFSFVPRYQQLFISNVACGGCHTILVGRIRDSHKDSSEISQLTTSGDQLQKKNSLPPLKLPIHKQQNDKLVSEKETEGVKDIDAEEESGKGKEEEGGKDENDEKVQREEETGSEKEKEKDKNCEVEKAEESEESKQENTKNHEKNTEESPDKTVDDSAHTNASGILNDHEKCKIEDVTESEEPEKAQETEPSIEKKRETGDITTEKTSEETHEESRAASNTQTVANNETSNTSHDNKNNKEESEEEKGSSEGMKSTADESVPGTGKPENSTHLPSTPKRNRDDIQSGEINPTERESSCERGSDMKESAEAEKGHQDESEQENTKKEETDGSENTVEPKKPPNKRATKSSSSSKSIKSRTDEGETIQIDNQTVTKNMENEKDDANKKSVENVANGNENEADEADVQSPVHNTAKRSRIFKKKHDEVENGTKAGVASNKSKSRTCMLL